MNFAQEDWPVRFTEMLSSQKMPMFLVATIDKDERGVERQAASGLQLMSRGDLGPSRFFKSETG